MFKITFYLKFYASCFTRIYECQFVKAPFLWNRVVSVTLEAPKFPFNFGNFFIAITSVATVIPPVLTLLNIFNLHFAEEHTLHKNKTLNYFTSVMAYKQ